jgi:hypothetical protein
MDTNKLNKLKEVGYRLQDCCATCVHSLFDIGIQYSDFGTCKIHEYEHQKHSDQKRKLSINKYGKCDKGYELKLNTAPFFMYLTNK